MIQNICKIRQLQKFHNPLTSHINREEEKKKKKQKIDSGWRKKMSLCNFNNVFILRLRNYCLFKVCVKLQNQLIIIRMLML
jgi:hypothetical protein